MRELASPLDWVVEPSEMVPQTNQVFTRICARRCPINNKIKCRFLDTMHTDGPAVASHHQSAVFLEYIVKVRQCLLVLMYM